MSEPGERPLAFDREALIARLKDDERFRALQEQRDEAEHAAVDQFARRLLLNKKPVDQRDVDFLRGYWAGARHWTGGRLTVAEQRLAFQAAAEQEEADA